MKVYNEIYPAEGWANKISKFLSRVVEQKPRMYAKTKRRYINLGCVLLDCAYKIFSILEENSLVPEDNSDEFNDLASSSDTHVLRDKLTEMVQKLQSVEKFSEYDTSSARLEGTSVKKPPGNLNHSESSKTSYYDTLKFYDTIFKEASIHNFGFSEVNECAKLIYKWFHTRFMPDVKDPNFHCQIRYLPTWISSFIITYGRYYQLSKLDSFRTMLDRWCEKVNAGEGGIYTMPYEIYRLDYEYKNDQCQASDYTIEAVIISDILVNECLFQLGDEEIEGMVRYNSGDVANIVRERNPSLLPKIRTRIAKRSELVREIGLTPVGGSDVDE